MLPALGAVLDPASAPPAQGPGGFSGYGGHGQQRGGGITFDRFVRCCVVVRQLTESFQRYVLVLQHR